MGSGSQIWRAGVEAAGVLGVGDCIYGRGRVMPEGVLELDNAWVSIFNFSGSLGAKGRRRQFTFVHDRDDLAPIPMSIAGLAKTPLGTDAVAAIGSLKIGAPLTVVGYTSPAGDLVATMIAAAPDTPVSPAESTPVITSTGKIIYGVATWQCCGGVSGCGSQYQPGCNPPPPGKGACQTCRTDQQGLAWPHETTTGCSAPCHSCCITLDGLACGTYVTICNMCPPNYCAAIPINDCGPNARCVPATRCQGYQVAKWDLTACTFTGIGGNLGAGMLDSQATYFI
jgi:hypothetical protein